MTTTPTPPPPPGDLQQGGPRVTRDEIRDLGRLRRTTGAERNIAGVAGGLGRHLDVDPVILRVAFVVLAFFGGAGLLLYGACWLLVPDDRSASAPLGLDDRSRTVGLVIAGSLAGLALLGSSLGEGFVPFPLVVVAGLALLVILQLNKRKGAGAGPHDTVAQAQAPGATAYAPPVGGTRTAVLPPPPVAWSPPPVRVNPRKRGPILFWFTAALCAIGLGVLGVVDLAGGPVADPAYPALVVGVVGAMLVLGAFWGRAGGLILVGLVATIVLAGSVAAQEIDGDRLRATPTTAAEVRSSYDIEAGELVLDLREVSDLAALDGRTIEVSGDIGRIEVIVPDGLDVTARGRMDGPGSVRVFGDQGGGLDDEVLSVAADTAAPDLRIEARLGIGEIDIRTAPFGDRTPR